MSRTFTAFVRAIEFPLAQDLFPAVWRELAAVLRRELNRRGLWSAPPSYLGVLGAESWESPEREGSAASTALDELLADCYGFIFVDRLRSLRAQLTAKPNIDGLVVLNVRHFVSERQRGGDPIGSRVFEVVEEAVEQALGAGELVLSSGEEKLANSSLLAGAGSAPGANTREELNAATCRFLDDLFPDLIQARGKRLDDVVGALRGRIVALAATGRFRFKDLVDPLKADARMRWSALLEVEQGERATELTDGRLRIVRLVRPRFDLLEDEDHYRLVRRIDQAIAELDIDRKTRDYLSKLWGYATSTGEPLAAAPDELSYRKIGEALGIPRERLPALLAQLGDVASRCRAQLARPTVETPCSHDQRSSA